MDGAQRGRRGSKEKQTHTQTVSEKAADAQSREAETLIITNYTTMVTQDGGADGSGGSQDGLGRWDRHRRKI